MSSTLLRTGLAVSCALVLAACGPQAEPSAEPSPSSGGQTESTEQDHDADSGASDENTNETKESGNRVEAQVTRVIDGDTIEASIDGKTYKVRYIGIDTPETVHPTKGVEEYGKEASAKNKELVGGEGVQLERDVSETDKYGRLLRYVYVGDLFVNAELVRLGYAQAVSYPPDVKYQDLFLELQREAREAGRGLWGAEESAEEPVQAGADGQFVGSVDSDKYHYPDCRWAKEIKPENEIWFDSVDEARAAGYMPCKVCGPPP